MTRIPIRRGPARSQDGSDPRILASGPHRAFQCMDGTEELLRMADDPELVVSVEFEHRRYHAFIGDRRHGYRVWANASDFESAVHWLQYQACRFYPHSKYVQELAATRSAIGAVVGFVSRRAMVH